MMLPRHIMFLKCVLLAGMALGLCSCAHQPLDPQWRINAPPQFDPDDPRWWWHPPKVTEIIPPSPATAVKVALHPEFTTHGTLRLPRSRYTRQAQATEESIRNLQSTQNELLYQKDALLAQARDNMGIMVNEWHDVLAELQDGAAKRWPDKSSKAYQDIIEQVLTMRQREEYNYHKAKGKKRDDIWCWLFLTNEQKQKIVQMYYHALQESQDAWSISQTLVTPTHRKVDKLLILMHRFVIMVDYICLSHKSISEDITAADKRFRQAQRELMWLRAKLEAEDDAKEKIRLNKQIADKVVEAGKLHVTAERKSRWLTSHTWQIDELAKAKDSMESCFQSLNEFHSNYRDVGDHVLSLSGQMSDQCDRKYRAIKTSVLQALSTARKHQQYLSPSAIEKLNHISGGTP